MKLFFECDHERWRSCDCLLMETINGLDGGIKSPEQERGGMVMSKDKDVKKETKKPAQKTLKEKRAEKRAAKAEN